ncbi:MAG: GGDEF domain-containing protein [Candidatus Thiodiazotropha taylori]|nr:GGDEF domain-containing protein [Candidatus Thiodiazotropha taylori]
MIENKIRNLIASHHRVEYLYNSLRFLFSKTKYPALLGHHRQIMVNDRIWLVSWFFAFMIIVCALPDFILLPRDTAINLFLIRLSTSALLIFTASSINGRNQGHFHQLRLTTLMVSLCLFYLFTNHTLSDIDIKGWPSILIGIYKLFLFFIIGWLSFFPITIAEIIKVSFSCFLVIGLGTYTMHDYLPTTYVAGAWILILIIIASMLITTIQLKYLASLIGRISLDELTGALSREAGKELIQIQIEQAVEENRHYAVAFLDLDHFKSVNDEFGHAAGDRCLKKAVQHLKEILRRGDHVIRWGGEEFLLILTDASMSGVLHVMKKIKDKGLGLRPDNTPLTASIGVAERVHERTNHWLDLIQIADKRMYKAKSLGRDQFVIHEICNEFSS